MPKERTSAKLFCEHFVENLSLADFCKIFGHVIHNSYQPIPLRSLANLLSHITLLGHVHSAAQPYLSVFF